MKAKLLKIFYNNFTIQHKLPINYCEEDIAVFERDITIHLPQSGLFVFKNVWVTNIGIIYKNLGAIKENIICYKSDFKNYRWKYLLKAFLTFEKRKYAGKKGILIFDNYSGPNGFSHWICDGLTRLAEINDTLNEYTIVVPSYFKNQKLYSDSLAFFNVSSIHYLEENSLTHFKELYFPSPIGDTGNFHPENIKKLRNIVHSKVGLPNKTNKNIYISRAKATRRFVKNEEEVTTLLKKYNFEIIYLEEHTFLEQVNIFYTAKNIISIHGAALAMLLFANDNTSILELRSETDHINNMYFLLASVSKLNYYYLLCKGQLNSSIGNNFDITVSIPPLEKTLQQMIAKQ